MSNKPHSRQKRVSNKTVEAVKQQLDNNNQRTNRPSPIRSFLNRLIKK